MTCSFCGSRNSEDDHRCRRCGRKPGDTLTGEFTLRTQGALAPKLEPVTRPQQQARVSRPIVRAVQQPLFPDRQSNVIAFEDYAPPRPAPRTKTSPAPPKPAQAAAPAKPAQPRPRRRVPEGQGTLDFLPPQPAKPRTLHTTVEAVIYCDAPVATTLHRAVAAALDWSMVGIGYGLFLITYFALGGEFTLDRLNIMIFAAGLVLIALLYGLTWTIAGGDTAGMRWAHLRLTTFEGFPPERKHRLLRFAGSCLSMATILGQLWCLADEESLTWQDHISRTFPTPCEVDAQVFRRV
jgi:uncharacterized RDD family membrane protein YckC